MKSFLPMQAIIWLLFTVDNADAAIVPAHDPTIIANGSTADDGMNLTLDTSTNREWLDLTLSDGLSFNTVAAQLGPGGNFEGFQHASTAEVLQFLQNLGLSTGSFPGMSDLPDSGLVADAAIDLLGENGVVSGIRFSQGMTSEAWPSAGNQRAIAVRNNGVTSTVQSGGQGSGTIGGQTGNFLYRSMIPEPASVSLLVVGFLGWSAIRRDT